MKRMSKQVTIVTDVDFEEIEIEQFKETMKLLDEARRGLQDGYEKERIDEAIHGLKYFIDRYTLKGWNLL